MNATEFTRRLRMVATASWLGALAVGLLLARHGLVRIGAALPFAALAVGAAPIALYAWRVRPVCAACGGRMRIVIGYPRIVYRCQACGAEEHTGIHADY